MEPRSRRPHHIETWKINAANMDRMFAAVYGVALLQDRRDAIDYLRSMHVDYQRTYTLSFAKSALGALNYRWVQELHDLTNVLRTHAQVERPTVAQLRSIGMTVVAATGLTVYKPTQNVRPARPNGLLCDRDYPTDGGGVRAQ